MKKSHVIKQRPIKKKMVLIVELKETWLSCNPAYLKVGGCLSFKGNDFYKVTKITRA